VAAGLISKVLNLRRWVVLRNMVMRGDEPPSQGLRALAAQIF
jgi:hypothetical protein